VGRIVNEKGDQRDVGSYQSSLIETFETDQNLFLQHLKSSAPNDSVSGTWFGNVRDYSVFIAPLPSASKRTSPDTAAVRWEVPYPATPVSKPSDAGVYVLSMLLLSFTILLLACVRHREAADNSNEQDGEIEKCEDKIVKSATTFETDASIQLERTSSRNLIAL